MDASDPSNSRVKSWLRERYHTSRLVYWYLLDTNFLRWRFAHCPRLREFHNRHRGEDCFIIGNGPSLNKMDLSPLSDYHSFGLNKIFLMFNRVDLDLSYHVAINPLVIEQSGEQFSAVECPSFLSYAAATPEMKSRKKYRFVYTADLPIALSKTIEQPISEGCTVTFVAMQIAYYMGFRRVFLIGVDHNFQARGKPHEKQIMADDDVNHFDPDYFKGMAWNLPDLDGSEVGYMSARYTFRSDGREILDATIDGKLKIFPKVSFEQALTLANKRPGR